MVRAAVALRLPLAVLVLAVSVPTCGSHPAPLRAPAANPWNLSAPAPHLLAHYVPWFQIDAVPPARERVWRHWKYVDRGPHHDPETRLPNGLRDIASVQYPLIGPYDSRSRAVVRYHLKTMKAAGIEGLIVDWYGKGDYTDRQIPLLLEEADRLNMRVALCYEEKINFEWRPIKSRAAAIAAATADLRHLAADYAGNPGYLKWNGRPVIFNFDGWGTGPIGPKMFLPDEFARILGALPVRAAYSRQGLAPDYYPTLAGAFQWWSSDARALRDFGTSARRMDDGGKLDFFAGMVSPGFDDTGVWGWGAGPRVTPREDLSLLRATFDLCFTGDPDLVQIVTWNDFNEGTAIEPTRGTGYRYLDALATWWAARRRRRVDLEAIREPYLEYSKECSAEERAELPAAPSQYLRTEPLTVTVPNYLDVLAQKRAK